MPPRDPNLPEGTDDIIGTDDMGFSTSSSSGLTGGTGSSGLGASSGVGGGGASDDPLGGMSGGTGALGGSGISGSQSGSFTSGATVGSTGGGMSGGGTDVQSLKAQASDKVRDVAAQGKDKATEALDSVSRLVSETADTVDDRLGVQYGDYVRRAGTALDGLNDSIRGKQVDELFDDARNMVRKSPAVAIGAAAAIGFLLVRLVKSGMPQTIDQDDDYYAGGAGGSGSTGQLPGTPPRVDNSYDPVA